MILMPICNIEDAFQSPEFDQQPNFYHNLAIFEPKYAPPSQTKMAIAFARLIRMASEGS